MKTAIVHYWLLGMRGGEKVIEALCDLFPDADIFTHVYNPAKISETINRHTIRTSYIQGLPFSRKLYKQYAPLMPGALEQLDLTAYDLVISSESGPAKGVIVRPDALHVCYCHTPMRYLWDQYFQYYDRAGMASKLGMKLFASRMRQWDVTSAARVDHFVANSHAVSARINKYWRRDSEVIAPPVDTQRFRPRRERDDFYLYVGEFVPYKRADLAVKACNLLGKRLIVIGNGPDINDLKKNAGPTIEFLGRVPDEILADHYAHCKALLFPAEEDFGIVPVEAMAAGAPVIAFSRGGAKDYVMPGETGMFFDEQTPAKLIEAIVKFELTAERFDPFRIANFARRFDRTVFDAKMRRTILERMDVARDMTIHRGQLKARWENTGGSAIKTNGETPSGNGRHPVLVGENGLAWSPGA